MADLPGVEWDGKLVPMGQPYDTGYDAVAPTRGKKQQGFNALLSDSETGEYVPMWIYDVSTDFSLSGSYGQSWGTRTFFPRNFVQPSFSLKGQAPSQVEYGKLAEFVHRAQRRAIFQGVLTGLTIPGSGVKTGGSGTKGPHAGLSAEGYVKSFPRTHERGVYSPDYTFSFVVSRIRSSIFHEETATVHQLRSFLEIMQSIAGDNFGKTFQTAPAPDQIKPGFYNPHPGALGQRRF